MDNIHIIFVLYSDDVHFMFVLLYGLMCVCVYVSVCVKF